MICEAMELSMIVLSTSLTRNALLSTPAIPAQNAPPQSPAARADATSSQAGQPGNVSAMPVAASAPITIWPSPPMLITPPR